jgi:hypothetical protein
LTASQLRAAYIEALRDPARVHAICEEYVRIRAGGRAPAQRVAKTKDGIAAARQRLSGGFARDHEYHDMRATLDQMVKDLPAIEQG